MPPRVLLELPAFICVYASSSIKASRISTCAPVYIFMRRSANYQRENVDRHKPSFAMIKKQISSSIITLACKEFDDDTPSPIDQIFSDKKMIDINIQFSMIEKKEQFLYT